MRSSDVLLSKATRRSVVSTFLKLCANVACVLKLYLQFVTDSLGSRRNCRQFPTGRPIKIMENRRRVQPLGKRSWMYRHPKTFQITFTVLGLGIFFSKPIYDIFIRPRDPIDFSEPPTTLQRGQVDQ